MLKGTFLYPVRKSFPATDFAFENRYFSGNLSVTIHGLGQVYNPKNSALSIIYGEMHLVFSLLITAMVALSN